MKMLDVKGFTLIELLAVLILLSIIMGIGSYSIVGILNNSRDKDYKLLIENINDAVEEYYIECKYSKFDGMDCSNEITLSRLVEYGYLKSNSTDETNDLLNPKDSKKISNCKIKYTYDNGKINIEAVDPVGSCPTSY